MLCFFSIFFYFSSTSFAISCMNSSSFASQIVSIKGWYQLSCDTCSLHILNCLLSVSSHHQQQVWTFSVVLYKNWRVLHLSSVYCWKTLSHELLFWKFSLFVSWLARWLVLWRSLLFSCFSREDPVPWLMMMMMMMTVVNGWWLASANRQLISTKPNV